MDVPTRNLSIYVKKKGINISKLSRDTGIPYVSLYDSLINASRDRDLRVGEFFMVCKFLGVNGEDFADKEEEEDVWRIDNRGNWVEEIHYLDGKTEILIHMGHTVEEFDVRKYTNNEKK